MEKTVQVALDGFTSFLEQEEHDHSKGQITLASKVLNIATVTCAEIRCEDACANLHDEMKPT